MTADDSLGVPHGGRRDRAVSLWCPRLIPTSMAPHAKGRPSHDNDIRLSFPKRVAVTVTAGQRRAEFAEAAPDQWSLPRCGPVFVNAELSASARPAELCRWSGGSELRPLFGDVHGLARTLLVPNQERGALSVRLLLWTDNHYHGEQIGSLPHPCPRLSPKNSPRLAPPVLR